MCARLSMRLRRPSSALAPSYRGHQATLYGRIGGPLLAPIDLLIELLAVKCHELHGKETGATSAELRQLVLAAPHRLLCA